MAYSSNFSKNVMTLKSSDGVAFEIKEDVLVQLPTIYSYFENLPINGRKFSVLDVTGATLGKVIEYCEKHVENPNSNKPEYIEELKTWDQEFFNGLDFPILVDVMNAANSLYVKSLLDFIGKALADLIRNAEGDQENIQPQE